MKSIKVEVVSAEPGGAQVRSLSLPAGSTVADALAAAGCAEWVAVGIFGNVVARETSLADGDRVELYRPLAEDPKEARRRRARKRR